MHLAVAFDQNYLAPFYALITSVLANNKKNSITVHAIVTGIAEGEKEKIRAYLEGHNCRIHYYTIDPETVSRFVLGSKWTAAVYYRLYFPLLVPDTIERLLYIDTDTLVVNDLSELYHSDLEGCPVAAVYDNYVKVQPALGIEKEGNYFNSGVLLMDVPQWRAQKVSENAFLFLQNYPERIKFVDQCALNAVLIDNWKKMDGRYNLMYSLIPQGMNRRELKEFIKDKVILHFTLQRPWQFLCRNRYRHLYRYYLNLSPHENKKVYTDFSLQKLLPFFRIRLNEIYNDFPLLQQLWRRHGKKMKLTLHNL